MEHRELIGRESDVLDFITTIHILAIKKIDLREVTDSTKEPTGKNTTSFTEQEKRLLGLAQMKEAMGEVNLARVVRAILETTIRVRMNWDYRGRFRICSGFQAEIIENGDITTEIPTPVSRTTVEERTGVSLAEKINELFGIKGV